jgi:hypothetical protein
VAETAVSDKRTAYETLCAYTLSRGDQEFIHQYVVDAFAAQQADGRTKPIQLTFALVGLYLAVEHGKTGREVQRVHMRLARRKQAWPVFALPSGRGATTAAGVLAAAEGEERDTAIRAWCRDVWVAFSAERPKVQELLRQHGII